MYKFLVLIIILLGFSCTVQDFNKVKTGTFIIENKTHNFTLIRTAHSQEEICEETGLHTKCDLIWLDKRNYALFNRSVLKGNDAFPEVNKTDTIYVEIRKIIPEGYRFRTTSNFSDYVMTGIAKIKK
jgi:hypothetical protein